MPVGRWCDLLIFTFQLFKSLHVQLEMRRKQVEGALQSTQRDGMLTVDQALVKQAWERVSNRVRGTGIPNYLSQKNKQSLLKK